MAATIRPDKNTVGEKVWIETNGFIVRSMEPTDITPQMLEWFNGPRLLTGLNLSTLHFDAEKMKRFIAGFDHVKGYFIGIFEPHEQRLVGFYTMDVNPVHRTGNITAGVSPEVEKQTKAVMWKTIDAFLDHFFEFRQVDKVTARVLATNRRMLFNFIGNPRFVYEGKLYKECMGIDGNRVDVLIFCTLKDPQDTQKAGKVMNAK